MRAMKKFAILLCLPLCALAAVTNRDKTLILQFLVSRRRCQPRAAAHQHAE